MSANFAGVWNVSGGARVRRAWGGVALWGAGAAALPPLLRWAVRRIAPFGGASALEWGSALAWISIVAWGASVAIRRGAAGAGIAARWRGWTVGAMRFVVAAGALVTLVSTRVDRPAGVFDAERALTLARSALLPALTEEIAFRGVLAAVVGSLLATVVGERRVRVALSLAVVSFAFALAHEGTTWPAVGWPLIAARSAAGLVFGALALRDRSLLAAMLAHAMYDAAVARCW